MEEQGAMPTCYYPIFVSLEKRVCLVVGGGAVGERKIRGLLQCGAAIRLVAEDLTPWLQTQCHEGRVLLVGRAYTKGCLDDVDLVFAATSDFALNRLIAADAQNCRLWCNMGTEPEAGAFIVPSILRRGPLTIAISTSGASPAVAVRIRQKLEHEFGTEWIVLLKLMALLRTTIQSKGLTSAQNQEIYRNIAGLPLLEWIQNGQETRALQTISESCHPGVSFNELKQIWDEAWKQSS
jgi:precorrin-2 dehydrogenase / sirohydrochlorin ferrochelatase